MIITHQARFYGGVVHPPLVCDKHIGVFPILNIDINFCEHMDWTMELVKVINIEIGAKYAWCPSLPQSVPLRPILSLFPGPLFGAEPPSLYLYMIIFIHTIIRCNQYSKIIYGMRHASLRHSSSPGGFSRIRRAKLSSLPCDACDGGGTKPGERET